MNLIDVMLQYYKLHFSIYRLAKTALEEEDFFMAEIKQAEKGSIKKPAEVRKQNKKKSWRGRDTQLTILAIPVVVWFILFSYLPMIGIILAFKNYRPVAGQNFFISLFQSDWAWLKNFELLFRTPDAKIMIYNTFFYNIIGIALGAILPVVMAIILSNLRSKKFMKTSQTMIFLPHFLSWVVVNNLLYSFLSPDRGYINNLITSAGGDPINWYSQSQYWRFILIFMNQWKGLGYSTVIYLSAITSIDGEMYEAAMIDGASKWQQTKYITIPHLRVTVAILLILAVGGIARTGLDMYYQLPRQSLPLYNQYMTVDVYVFNAATGNGNIAQGSAVGFLQSVIGLILIVSTNLLVRKVDPESSLF